MSKLGPVLIADDEVLIGALVEDALREAGYQVTTVETGAEALAILEEDGGFVGLVTDINFGCPPVGWDVASRAREINPKIAVVYMTGGSAHEWCAHGVPESTVVTKPFAPSRVAVVLADLLAAIEASSPP